MVKLFYYGKDGGKDSVVSGLWLIEAKNLFSVVFLKFSNGSREAFHNHAFNSISFILKGKLEEFVLEKGPAGIINRNSYGPSLIPIITKRNTFHKVYSRGNSYVISFRGPWKKHWKEYWPKTNEMVTLSSGRKIDNKEVLRANHE